MLGQWFLVDADAAKFITIGAGDYFVQNPLEEEYLSLGCIVFLCHPVLYCILQGVSTSRRQKAIPEQCSSLCHI